MNIQRTAFIDIYKDHDKYQRVIAVANVDISTGVVRLNTGWDLGIFKVENQPHSYEIRFDSKRHKNFRCIN